MSAKVKISNLMGPVGTTAGHLVSVSRTTSPLNMYDILYVNI